jgi:hypothetical protein
MAPLVLDGVAVAAIITKLLAALAIAGILVVPAMAVEVWPDPDLTGGSVRIDGHDRLATCGHAKEHRGPMNASRRDEILMRYGLPPGTHPSYEIDHLIPLCLGGGDYVSLSFWRLGASLLHNWRAPRRMRPHSTGRHSRNISLTFASGLRCFIGVCRRPILHGS